MPRRDFQWYRFIMPSWHETETEYNDCGSFDGVSGSGVDGAGGLIFQYAVFYQPSEN